MRTCIAAVCIPGALHEKLAAIAAAGFRAVEIFEFCLIIVDAHGDDGPELSLAEITGSVSAVLTGIAKGARLQRTSGGSRIEFSNCQLMVI